MATADLEARLAHMERELAVLTDRAAITDVINRYCKAVDHCDLQGLKDCYWPDAVDDHGFFSGPAHDFCEHAIPVLLGAKATIHSITNTIIEFRGEQAAVESQVRVFHRLPDGERFQDWYHNCRYHDIFEKREGVWKLLVRVATVDLDRVILTNDLDRVLAQVAGNDQATLEIAQMRGGRFPDDRGYLGFNIRSAIRPRVAMSPEQYWDGFRAIARLMQ